MDNRDVFIRTILGEAGGEDAYGQAAVGQVILNRTRDRRWGGSVADVVLAPKQFSTWNSGAGGNNPSKWDPNSEEYKRTGKIVDALMAGEIPDMTGGATHYYSPAGMQKLVADGDQGNTIPRWLQAETDRRGGETYQYGGHIFTGKADGPALTVSSKGEAPALQQITMSGLDGGPGKDNRRDAWFNPTTGQWQEGGRPLINEGSMDGAFKPDWYFPGGSGGGGATVSTQGQPPLVAEEPLAPPPKIGQKGWLTPNRSDMLLAIGSGLLSGDDWASGGAQASANLLGLSQSRKDEEYRQQVRMDKQNGVDEPALRKIPMGQVEMPDGSIRIDLLQDPTTGVITDSKGQTVDVSGAERRNNGDVFGSKGQMTPKQAQEEQSYLVNTGSALQAFDRTMYTVEGMKFGIEGFAETMSAYVQTMAGRGLTAEQINRMVTNGDIQGLVGASREAVVGPGVMTEQDAARVTAYLVGMGMDVNSIISNPDVALERLKIARENSLKEYDQRYRQYEEHNKRFQNTGYIAVAPYQPWTPPATTSPGALDSSNAGPTGAFNPDEINSILDGLGIK